MRCSIAVGALVLLVVGVCGQTNVVLTRVELNDPNAVCLDGSPYSYYISQGPQKTKFYFNHQGGGWCANINECIGRVRYMGAIGSSKTWNNTVVETDSFSRNPTLNPLMYDWTMVFLPYCDGGSFTGNSSTATGNATVPQLYFHGLPNRLAVVESLRENYGFNMTTDLVVSGCSAGGLAAYVHVDFYAQQVPNAYTRGLPDSGFFLDGNYARDNEPDYEERISSLYAMMNSSVSINPDCNAKLGYKCLFAYHLLPFIKTPVFALNSVYDASMANGQCGHSGIIFNWTDPSSVNACGNYIRGLFRVLLAPPNGAFLDSCQHHCGEWGDIHIYNLSSPYAVQIWYEKGPSALPHDGYIDQNQTYPCTSCCLD